jgi:hypothetical protein
VETFRRKCSRGFGIQRTVRVLKGPARSISPSKSGSLRYPKDGSGVEKAARVLKEGFRCLELRKEHAGGV